MKYFRSIVIAAGACAIILGGCGSSSEPSIPSGDTGPDVTVDTGGDSLPSDVGQRCTDPDNDGYGPDCDLGPDCHPADGDSYPGAPERCGDGIDNNCDGTVDEECPCEAGATQRCYTGASETEGIGSCDAGSQTCTGGTWSACMNEVLPSAEVCDGLDNDCDQMLDEEVRNACGTCGEVPLEVCDDSLDNDCDGTIDEPDAGCFCDGRTRQPCYGGAPNTRGQGECRGGIADCTCPGADAFCTDGAWGACLGQVLPNTELCDYLDNDCDGRVDEGLRNACGECGETAEPEICDNVDNDCDGDVDEGVRLLCGLCPGEETSEQCGDGIDNDCNGAVDEGCSCVLGDANCYPGNAELVGVGICSFGSRTCDPSGEFWGACSGFTMPSSEICDGLDNNCDGAIDIGPAGCSVCDLGVELCDNVDNDCDGVTDEGVRNRCGVCVDEVVNEETQPALCNGADDDCDGLVDEGLVNACGACDDSCYVEGWGTDPSDWEDGEFEGIDEDVSEGLRLGTQRFSFPDLWVANSADVTPDRGSVTRINTTTGAVIGTYNVGPDPSRTAVDFDGNAWVANRGFGVQGSVTLIHADDCVGDACIGGTVNVGAVNAVVRGLTIDAEGYPWAGTYNGQEIHRINPETLEVEETYGVAVSIYGLTIDSEGIMWISSRGGTNGAGLSAFDTNTRTYIGFWNPGGCVSPYGIAVDADGNVWMGNYSCSDLLRFDRAAYEAGTPSWSRYTSPGIAYTRGVAIDGEGYIWLAASNSNMVAKFDPRTGSFVGTYATCSAPIGVGVANDGNIWTMCYGANEARQFHPDGSPGFTAPVGSNPYSYSDMTGFALRNFTAPRGTWRTQYDCGFQGCKFDSITWTANQPVGTTVAVRARTSTDQVTWSPWSPEHDVSPALIGDEIPRGRFLELEVLLASEDDEVTPTVSGLDVNWQRP